MPSNAQCPMDWQQLEYFRLVARLQHVTQAAHELNMTQPALSRAIARLEQEIGVPLFDRTARSLTLTRYGEAFLEHVERALHELDQGRRQLADMAGLEHGLIALGFLPTLGTDYAPQLIRRFLHSHPNARFTLVQNVAADLDRGLLGGELNLVLSYRPSTSGAISWRQTGEQELVLAVPPGHRFEGRRRLRLAEASGEPFVACVPTNPIRHLSDELCRSAGFVPKIAFEATDSGSVRGFVAAGFGVAVVPAIGYETGIQTLRITEPHALRPIGINWVKERYLSVAERTFRDFALAADRAKLPVRPRTPRK
jgi:DNA-binding transcriptional LysR family regulator